MPTKRITIKNHLQEIQLISQRVGWAFAFICLLIILLVARLGYLQIYKHNLYATLSTKNWLDLVPSEPTRGLIYDRNGVMLAENIPVFSLDLIPDQITNLEKTLLELQKIILLTPDDINQFKRQLRQHRRFDEIPLKIRLTDEEVSRFAENQYRFPGVKIKARLMRHYPFAESFSHVIGYVGRINAKELNEIDPINYSASHYIGKSGIEKYYEEELHGRVGYDEVENDASGKAIRVLKEIKGTPGKNLYLTIDSGLQFTAEKALQGHRGAIVAIQPATGQVLAMVSQPGYDPNLFVSGISHQAYKALRESADRPLFDRALHGLYPLASTIKPYLALGALEAGVITADDNIYDQGWFELRPGSHRYHDWQPGHGMVNMARAIMVSCDIYFYQLAVHMGIRRMDQFLAKFGFGTQTGIDLDDEYAGILASPEWKLKMKKTRWYDGDTVISGIGQGYMQATPVQLAAAIATMANRGQRFMPYLLLGEQTPGQAFTPQPSIPLEAVTLQNPENWDDVIDAMKEVVNSPQGTAHTFGTHSYSIAAKTGTAAIIARRRADREDNPALIPERFRDHHLFVAFAPVDQPQIAVAVVTENSSYAIQVTRAMFDYYLGKKQNAIRNKQASSTKK